MTEVISSKYRQEPPEGGWGLLICLGMALSFITPLSAMPSFAIMFDDFLKERGEQSSATAVITMSFFMAMSFAGLFSSSLFKRFSVRTVGIMGGSIFFIGTLIQIFVQSTWQLFVAFSICQGIGFGLTMPTSYTTFNSYFVKRRVMMMSVAQSMIGVGTMVYPLLIKELLKNFGFRGCLAVNAAFNAHCVFGMLLMHPVEWHMRKVKIDEETENKADQLDMNNKKTDIESNNKPIDQENLQPLLIKRAQDQKSESHRSLHEITKEANNSIRNSIRSLEIRASERASSIASLGNWTGAVVANDNSERTTRPVGKWKLIVDFLDLTLLKQPSYVNLALGVTFALYSDVAFFTFQPSYLMNINFTRDQTAIIVAVGASADLLSRIVLAFSSAFVSVSARNVFLSGAFFTIVARCAFLQVYDETGMMIITAVMGFLRTWVHVTLPLVFAEYLPKERFASGYGLFMFLQGNIMFAVGPIVGYIRDSTNSYHVAFHILNFFMALCVIPWVIEILYLKYTDKNNKSKNIEMINIRT